MNRSPWLLITLGSVIAISCGSSKESGSGGAHPSSRTDGGHSASGGGGSASESTLSTGGSDAGSTSLPSSTSFSSSSSTSSSTNPIPTHLDDSLLPPEPKLPTTVCATLAATQQAVDGRLPDSLDADPANSQPDTKLIQDAINACPAGQAVKLVTSGAKNGFLAGRLSLKSDVLLWVDAGVTLFASRSPKDYDNGSQSCGDASETSAGSGCLPWITAAGTANSGIVGDGIVDGRGGSVMTSGARANQMTWWDLAMQTKATPALTQNNPRMLQVTGGSNFTLYRITFQNGPKFHVATDTTKGVTVWGLKLVTPSLAYSAPGYGCAAGTVPTPTKTTVPSTCFTPETVKNTDGFDPGNSSNVVLAHSYISTGDDNVAIKSGGSPSMANQFYTRDHLYAHNHFYYGHGMSIGSETNSGVDRVYVWDLVSDGEDSSGSVGIRIKTDGSRGGEIKNVVYQDICARRLPSALVFDPYYASVTTPSSAPNMHDITLRGYHYVLAQGASYNTTKLTFNGYTSSLGTNPLRLTLDNVVFDDGTIPTLVTTGHNGGPAPVANAEFVLGPGPVDITLKVGGSVTVTDQQSGTAVPVDCSKAFEAFPSSSSPLPP